MRAETKIRRQVMMMAMRRYHGDPGSIAPAFEKWAMRSMPQHNAYLSKGSAWCSECGCSFPIGSECKKAVCPQCGHMLHVVKSRRRSFSDFKYLQSLEACGEWQIINTYLFYESFRKGSCAERGLVKIYQFWIDSRGKKHLFSRGLKCYAYRCVQPFACSSDMIMRRVWSGYFYNGWCMSGSYPHNRITPMLRKRLGRASMHGWDAVDVIDAVLFSPRCETMWKAGQHRLALYFGGYGANNGYTWWKSVLVALRHGFDFNSVSHISDYFDYLRNLEELGKDTRSPRYLCPADFKKAHDEALEKVRNKREEERRRAELEEDRERASLVRMAMDDNSILNRDYRKRLGNLLCFAFTSGDITLSPLASVGEFYKEGEELHHCVFENRYYEKDNCLILDAAVKGERTETIEIDLSSMQVVQCRGKYNQASEYHDMILNVMNSNMYKLKSLRDNNEQKEVKK